MRTVRPARTGARGAASLVVAMTAVFALSACGDDEPSTQPTVTETSSTAEEPTSEPTTEEATTTSEPPTTEVTTEPADTADVEIEVTVAGDTVTTASDRVAVEVGQTVRLVVTADADDEVHVHGFELTLPLVAGTPAELEFEVGTTPGPGLYEVETHESGLLLLQLEVR